MQCPECLSERLTKKGFRWIGRKVVRGPLMPTPRRKVQQWLCGNCGKVFAIKEG